MPVTGAKENAWCSKQIRSGSLVGGHRRRGRKGVTDAEKKLECWRLAVGCIEKVQTGMWLPHKLPGEDAVRDTAETAVRDTTEATPQCERPGGCCERD